MSYSVFSIGVFIVLLSACAPASKEETLNRQASATEQGGASEPSTDPLSGPTADALANFTPILKSPLKHSHTAPGKVQLSGLTQVGAEVSGRIDRIFVKPGDQVLKGQILASLEKEPFLIDVDSAKARLMAAQSRIETLRLDGERLQKAIERRKGEIGLEPLVPAEEAFNLENQKAQNETQIRVAMAEAKLNEAALRRARFNLKQTDIFAPVEGQIITTLKAVGEAVNATQSIPILFEMGSGTKDLKITAKISEEYFPLIAMGAKPDFRAKALKGKKLQARVVERILRPTSNKQGVFYPIELRIETPDPGLLPGMNVALTFIFTSDTAHFLVPNYAFFQSPPNYEILEKRTHQPGYRSLWVADASGAWVERSVLPGYANTIHTEILGGDLEESDLLPPR